jgi:hypothetical protein
MISLTFKRVKRLNRISGTCWAISSSVAPPSQLEALAALLGVYADYPRAPSGMMIVREEPAKLEEP